MIESEPLKSANPSLVASMSSIWMLPVGSFSLRRQEMRDDLPAPVRPTMPTFKEIIFQLNKYGGHCVVKLLSWSGLLSVCVKKLGFSFH